MSIQTTHEVTPNAHNYGLSMLKGDLLEHFWPHVSEMMDKIPHTLGYLTKEEIHSCLVDENMTLWGMGPIPNATFVFITAIHFYPSKNVLTIGWAAGQFKRDMIPILDAGMVNYAKAYDCTAIEIHGRAGWARMFKSIGFKPTRTVLARPVPNQRTH